MDFPENIKYTKEHVWVRVEGDEAIVGISDFAQSELGDIVFVELPAIGVKLEAGTSFCVVESTKAASDVYAPVSGEVIAVNELLENDPSLVNNDPYQAGWLVKVTSPELLNPLMSADEYQKLVNG